MGEAKRRRKLKEQILAEYPFCIYCGGTEPASTVDHFPAISCFAFRQRPRGLEFPACEACNRGGRLDEQVAAALSRVYPDPPSQAGLDELTKIFLAVTNNHPGLLEEMSPTFRQEKSIRTMRGVPPDCGALNCKGPLLNNAMQRFAAKAGYALHFELTKTPVPPAGGVATSWFTNYQALKGDIPQELIDRMGNPQTLRQGTRQVDDQFRYASLGHPEGSMTAHFASFRFSFAVVAFVGIDAETVRPPKEADHVRLHLPGWLKAPAFTARP